MGNNGVFIIAGEASGDLHASALISEIKHLKPETAIEGIGGEKLSSSGVRLLFNYSEVNFAGFSEIVRNYSHIKKKLYEVRDYIVSCRPKIVILTDFPGFNLRLAEELRKNFKGKIIYYITPQIWAWHKSRINKIRKFVDICLVIFPFEKDIFSKAGIKSYYVGHPLVDTINKFSVNREKKANIKPVVTLMPGSRLQEVKRILPVMTEAAEELITVHNCDVKIICSENIDKGVFDTLIDNPEIKRTDSSKNLETIYNSDFVITKFGTSTLECGLLGTPFCAVYRSGFLNYLIGRSMIRIDHVSLVNIVMGREIVKEFIQYDFTKENIINEYLQIRDNNEYRNKMLSAFIDLKNYFRDAEAGESAARIIIKEL